MQNYTAKNLAASWRTVRKNTIQIAEEIPAEQYGFKATPETRSVGELLAHMACVNHYQEQIHFVEKKMDVTGPDFGRYFGEIAAMEKRYTTKQDIVDALIARGEAYALELEAMTDARLDEMVGLPGPASKSRFEMLLGVKEHEMHHRAQLMVMQRMLGIIPHLTRARMG